MDEASAQRLAAAAGIAMVVAYLIGYVASGTLSIGWEDSAAEVARSAFEHRTGALFGVWLLGFAFGACLPVFAAGLFVVLRRVEGRAGALSIAFIVASALVALLVTMVLVPFSVLAYRSGTLEPDAARLLYDTGWLAVNLSEWPTLVSLLAFAAIARRSEPFPAYVVRIALATAALDVLSAASYARSGLFQPNGAFGTLAAIGFAAWVLTTSLVLLREVNGGRAGARTT